jgi:predicted esterase
MMWAKDLGRTIDYVETRADLDPSRIALYGYSWGANLAPLLLAVEGRIKAGVLMGGGLVPQECFPEADPFHFGQLVKQPVLLITGRYDFLYPLESSQLPLFRSLGTRTKRHAVFDTGHMLPNDVVQQELIAWLDEHLGPAR